MSFETYFAFVYCILSYAFPLPRYKWIINMPGFLPRRPTCFDEPEIIRAYLVTLPNITRYVDDYVDNAGNPLINWSGIPRTEEHWNSVYAANSEVFTEHDTHSVWGSEVPSLEDEPTAWQDADWAEDFSADFDETGWPLNTFNWDNPRPFTFFWPPTLQIDADTRRSLLLWHAAMQWGSRDVLPIDFLDVDPEVPAEPVINQDA